jgi:hypothetical protein
LREIDLHLTCLGNAALSQPMLRKRTEQQMAFSVDEFGEGFPESS